MFRIAAAVMLTLCVSSVPVFAADENRTGLATLNEIGAVPAVDVDLSQLAPGSLSASRPDTSLRRVIDRPLARPAVLPVLYVGFAALQVFDIYSTRQALAQGAHESNPVMQGIAGNPVAFAAVKVATAMIPMLIAERMWKTHRIAAIVTMVAANSAMAMVAANNARVLRQLR
jgi:hypothetical protein